jgi:amidase
VPLPGGAEEHWFGLSAAGPITRTAADAALMLGVLSGTPVDLDGTGPARVALSLRVPSPIARLQPEQEAAVVGAAARLRAHPDGTDVVMADPPYPLGLMGQWVRRWQAGVARDAETLGLDLSQVERRTATVVRKGRRVLRFAPPRASAATRWRDRVLGWMDEGGFDLLMSPAVAAPAVGAGTMLSRRYQQTFLVSARRVPCTQAWNLAGLPAVVAPVLVDGFPVGVQFVGRPGSEAALLAAAARVEQRLVPVPGAAAPHVSV